MKIIAIRQKGKSALLGDVDETISPNNRRFIDTPILKAFLEDCDVQEITVCSANIGFVYTFTKVFESESAKALGNKI